MDDQIETLMVEVRASTSGFSADIDTMRASVDNSLADGFARAGNVLERGLLNAIRRGSLGFEDFKAVALRAMNEIAAHALKDLSASLFGGGGGGGGKSGGTSGLAEFATSLLGSLLGLPGRATGGPVSPGRPYLVGERGPEMFVPTSAGRVETGMIGSGGGGRDVRVAINLGAPRGTESPVMLRRSTRQIASAVRRAMQQA